MLKKIIQSPYLNILSGIILLFTAGYETWSELGGEISPKAHHGILFFSLIHIARSLPEVMHGLKELDEGKEEIHEK